MTVPALVFVHSPFVGPSTWAGVARVFRAAGRRAIAPSLRFEAGHDRSHFNRLAQIVADAAQPFEGTVLIFHSGAGSLAPMIATACNARAVCFVDAILPHPGRSWLSTLPGAMREHLTGLAPDGWLPTWERWFPMNVVHGLLPDDIARARFLAELPRVPLAYARELAPSTDALPERCAYFRLSSTYESEACQAERRGWPTRREERNHLAMLTDPAAIARSLQGLFDELALQ
jgi:hypothetical protein